MLVEWIDRLVGTPSADRVERLRVRLFVVFSFLVVGNGVVFGLLHVIHHVPGSSWAVTWVIVGISLMGLASLAAIALGVAPQHLIPAFMVTFEGALLAIACLDGGLASGAVFWLAFLPLAASFVGGPRLGWTVTAASVGAGLFLFTAEAAGVQFPSALSADDGRVHFILNFMFAAGLTGVLAALYEGPMASSVRQLAEQLDRTHATLQSESEERRRAQAHSRAKDALLANLSHEFRTPLTAILSGAEILDTSVHPEDQAVVATVSRGARRLLATLDGVIDLSRIDRDEAARTAAPLCVASVGRGVAREYAPAAQAKGVRLDVSSLDPPKRRAQGPPLAHADPTALARALGAVVDNAVRFTERGAVTLSLTHTREEVEVAVQDTGIGIEPAFLGHATEPFRQASEGHNRSHEGLGVGLALARQLVEAMGGRLNLESVVGQGTTVRLVLPRAQTPQPDPDAEAAPVWVARPTRQPARAVLADAPG